MLDPTVQQVTESHRKGYIHIHKSDNSYGYCSSFDLIDVKKESSPRFVRRLIREWSGCIRLNINRDLISLENFIGFNRASKKTDSEIILNLSYNSETYDYLNKFSVMTENSLPRLSLGVLLNDGFAWESEDVSRIFTLASKYGYPLFINGKANVNKLRSVWVENGDFRYNTGSIGSISLNLPRLAFETSNEDSLLALIGEHLRSTAIWFEKKKLDLSSSLDNGKMPATKKMEVELDEYYGSIGLVGVNEALKILSGSGIETIQGKAIAYKILEYVIDELQKLEAELGHPFSLDSAPTDDALLRLNDIDRIYLEKYGIKTEEAYTNSSNLPINYTDDLWDALEHQKKLQSFYNGTTIFDIPISGEMQDPDGCKLLVERIKEKFGIPCFGLSPLVKTCKIHGKHVGSGNKCPLCNKPLESFWRWEIGYRKHSELSKSQTGVWEKRRPFDIISRR